MPTIDFTSGYRDSTQGATLKALALRRAELSAALGARKPRKIDDPWQGAAEVADTISGGIREGRLANQEAAGRARFAQLLAGGLAPDEIGEAMGLDPETTMKYQERTWATEDRDTAAKQREQELTRGHGWDVDAATARAQVEADRQKELFGHQDTTAKTLAGTQEQAAISEDTRSVEEQKRQEGVAAEQGLAEDPVARANANLAAGKISQAEHDAIVAKETHITQPASLNQDRKALWGEQDAYANTSSTVGQLNEAKQLLTEGINWGRLEGPLKTQIGASGFGSDEDKQMAQRTLRYNTIMGGQALLSLAEVLKGASSDKDVAVFMDIMNNAAMDPTTKAKAIDDMLTRVSSHQELQRDRIRQLGGDLPEEQPQPEPDEEAASLDNARKAIAANPAIADMVKKRLLENGIDPGKL